MKDLAYFKDKLTALRVEVSNRIDNIDKDVRHEVSSDWPDQATERENDEVLDSLSHSSAKTLQRIDYALNRIETGEYFTCQNCGNDIPAERLELLPFATNCVSCAEGNEH